MSGAAALSSGLLVTDEDEAAFKAELTEVIPALRAFARALTGDAARADDLAQETLLKAWAARASYALGTSLKSWAYKIMRNAFLSEARRAWRTQSLDSDAAHNLRAADDPRASLEFKEVTAAIQTLPPEYREALILVAADGFSYEEAADLLGVQVGTVKSRVSRARDRLEKLLDTSAQADRPREEARTRRRAAS